MPRAALIATAAWAALVLADGGLDVGRDPQRLRGPTGAVLAALVLVPMAALALHRGIARRLLGRSWGRALLGGSLALLLWASLSILWASAPDLAWIESNHGVLALGALLVGAAFSAGDWRGRGPDIAAVLLAAGCTPAILLGLATKVSPHAPFADGLARLHGPMSAPNAMALVAALAVPGALHLAARADPPRALDRAAAALVTLALAALVLTYSRSGVLAAVSALVVLLGAGRARRRTSAVLAAAAIAAVPAVAYGLGAHALTTDGLSAADREGPGLVLGVLLLVGAIASAAVASRSRSLADRVPVSAARHAALAVAVAVAGALTAAVVVAVRSGDDGAIANGSDRLASASFNNRLGWWAEALRGLADAPLVGHGAGSFPLTHLRERPASDLSSVRQPHQLTLQIASELGAVGVVLSLLVVTGVVLAVLAAARAVGRGRVAPAFAVLAAVAVHTGLDVSWDVPAVAVAAAAIVGVLAGAALPVDEPRRAGSALVATTPVLCVALLASALAPWAATVALDRARSALSERRLADARSSADLAVTLNPLDIRGLLVRASVARIGGDTAARISAGRDATARQPENPFAWACLATSPAPAAERARALAQFDRLAPHGGERLRNLARC